MRATIQARETGPGREWGGVRHGPKIGDYKAGESLGAGGRGWGSANSDGSTSFFLRFK